MSGQSGQTFPEGPVRPGDNPNVLNAKPRKGARPKTKNSQSSSTSQMRLNWIDPLPQIDVAQPLGLEPNPEVIPAGEIELDFALPETIAEPFAQLVNSVGDRIQLIDDDKESLMDQLRSLSCFKAARQLYSTMLDHEKAVNQPLKAVYYDETPIPSHMAGALGIIGHMDTKVGKVLVKDAGVLFKRWVARGLQISDPTTFKGDPRNLVWNDRDSYQMVQRLAKDKIAELVKQTYQLDVGGTRLTVSMPQLTDQNLQDYYGQINNNVPGADDLRHAVSALQMSYSQYRNDDGIPNNNDRQDILTTLGLDLATGHYDTSGMRDAFEDWCARYTTDYRWRVDSILKTGPPPAGTTGYGAQTVSATGNVARWQYPLSDADVNIGYLFSPVQEFKLYPRLIGYSRRDRTSAQAAFAARDGKAFVN